MKYSIHKNTGPIYLQLYKQIRDDIINQNYLYNSKLPSKRALAEDMGISTITVEHAYALLCDEGYIEPRQRSGYIVIFRKSDGFARSNDFYKQNLKHNDIYSYPDFPLTVMSKTMRKVLNDYNEIFLKKSDNCGCAELRDAIRRYLARNRGINVETEQIIIGAGSEYLYRLIIQLLGNNKIYGIESPSYKKIEQVYKANQISYEFLELTNSGIDSNALINAKADILHTTPYRSYPTGITATASKLHEYIRWSSKNNKYIIEDDFESEFSVSTKSIETLFSLSKNDNVIYLNTFSKTISPSMRIGYMVLPKHLVNVFNQKLGFYSCTVSMFMQLVLAELINNGDFERHINRVRRKIRKESEKF